MRGGNNRDGVRTSLTRRRRERYTRDRVRLPADRRLTWMPDDEDDENEAGPAY